MCPKCPNDLMDLQGISCWAKYHWVSEWVSEFLVLWGAYAPKKFAGQNNLWSQKFCCKNVCSNETVIISKPLVHINNIPFAFTFTC